MTRNIILILLLLGVVYGVYEMGHSNGQQSERLAYLKKAQKLEAKLDKLKKESAKQLAQVNRELKERRRQADAKVQKHIARNKTARKWWNDRVPQYAADHAYGL